MTVKELPLLLYPVERDPFLDSISGDVRPGAGEVTGAPAGAVALDREELHARSRHPEFAA